MPELPEVETVKRGLQPLLEGAILTRVIQRRPDLRFPIPSRFVERLEGQRLRTLRRRAKYLLGDIDSGEVLLVHLGMSGRIQRAADAQVPFEKHDHLIFETDGGVQVRFNDARRFGFVDLFAASAEVSHPRLMTLGPEPLGNGFSAAYLAGQAAGRIVTVKTLIMNAAVVVGVGNIYASESLFVAGIHPNRAAGTLTAVEIEQLVAAIRKVLARAIEVGGSSLSDYVQVSGELGYFQHEWQVYGREGEACRTCKTAIARHTQAQRSSFYCPNCQKAAHP